MMFRTIYKYFQELNLFKLETAQMEGFDRSLPKIATQFYIISLTLALIVLTCFIALDVQSETIFVKNPSLPVFIDLDNRFSSTLSCPCEQITTPLRSFTSINVSYHPICDSVFVSELWINILFNPNISFYYPLDFRSTAMGHFQLLSSLCSIVKRFVDDAIDDFLAETFLTPVALSEHSLDIKIQTLDLSIQISTINSFRQVLQLLRSATFTNQLQTALQTSILQAYYQYTETGAASVLYEGTFSNSINTTCRCAAILTCTSLMTGFFDLFAVNTRGSYISYNSLIHNVTGFVAGCYLIESFLQSQLECLYDAACLSGILRYFPHSNTSGIGPLNSSTTKFSPQSTVDTLLDSLFIETWNIDIFFHDFYEQCAPILCTYTWNRSSTFLYIITQLLSFYGGLTIALRLAIPRILLVLSKFRRPRQQNHNQVPLLERIRVQIIQLNLFKTREERNDPYELNTSRMATRIFLLLTALCVAVLSIYTAAMVQSRTVIIDHPDETDYRNLHSKYANTLKCPCDRIAIAYETFVDSTPQLHPVCTSQYISSAWIDSLSTANWINEFFDVRDFRVCGQVFFSSMSTLCDLIQIIISNAWYVFQKTYLIGEQLLSDMELKIHSSDVLDRFKSNIIVEFKRALLITQFQTSTLFAVGSQNYAFILEDVSVLTETGQFETAPSMFGNCSCAVDDRCLTPVGFFNKTPETAWSLPPSIYDLPQFYTGCFVMQSVLQSSLQCFYNQTCLDRIQSDIISPKSINISILQSNGSRFSPEATISELIDQLMVENWGDSINYSNYYTQCQPKECLYMINSRSSISYMITSVIGLCGGVIVALKAIIPIIVRFLRQRCRPKADTPVADLDHSMIQANRFRQVLQSIRTKILEFNLFETELSWDDPDRRDYEIISTRIHLLLLTITCCIMIIYTAFGMKTETITIHHPSMNMFEKLGSNEEYLSTLQCPCQNITIPFHSFTFISFGLHQLCTSEFIQVNSLWTDALFIAMISERHEYNDFRPFALLQFRLLASLCQLANETMTDAVKRFSMSELITDQAKLRDSILTKANLALAQLRISTARNFVRTLDFTRSITQGNGIVAATLSNWRFVVVDQIDFNTVWTVPRAYDDPPNCSCATSSMCTSSATIDGIRVPGFRVGCFALDSLLQSTLECLYNRSCIQIIQGLDPSMNFTITPLDSALSSPNATVQDLINDLLINEWKTNVLYDRYYEQCAPVVCSYSITRHADILYIATASIGFYGGLSAAIKIIAPIIAKAGKLLLILYRRGGRQQTIVVPITG